MQLGEEGADGEPVHLTEIGSARPPDLPLEKGGELAQVRSVGTDRLGRAVLVQLQVPQIGANGGVDGRRPRPVLLGPLIP
jgi:hypothetical protein